MDYVLLNREIETDPESVGYSTMSDAEIAASLSAQAIRVRQRVPIERLRAVAMETGVYSALKMAIKAPETPPQLAVLCETALDLVSARFPDIDLDNPVAVQMFSTLRQYGVISTQQATEIDTLATARHDQPSGAARPGRNSDGVRHQAVAHMAANRGTSGKAGERL